jgi:hypothetical protein
MAEHSGAPALDVNFDEKAQQGPAATDPTKKKVEEEEDEDEDSKLHRTAPFAVGGEWKLTTISLQLTP